MRRRAFMTGIALLAAAWCGTGFAGAGQVEDVAALMRVLSSVGGVAGHEGQVRAAIRKAAPSRASFGEDNLGHPTVPLGSAGTGLLPLAPMDEPGYAGTAL